MTLLLNFSTPILFLVISLVSVPAVSAKKTEKVNDKEMAIKAWEVIENSAKNGDAYLKEQAAVILGYVDEPKAKDLLRSLLQNKDDFVKIQAAGSLGRLGDSSGGHVLRDILLTQTDPNMPKNINLPPAVVKLQAMARAKIRSQAAYALGRLGDKNTVAALQETKKDEDGRVRDASGAAMARLGDRAELAIFMGALKDKDSRVRVAAAEALAEIAAPESSTQLLELLEDAVEEVRVAGALALRNLAVESGQARNNLIQNGSFLVRALSDPSALVRQNAAKTLGMMGYAGARDSLKSASRDPNGYVSIAACAALGQLGEEKEALEILQAALNSDDGDARMESARALFFVPGKDSVYILSALADDKDSKVKLAAAGSLYRKLKSKQQ